MMLESPNHNDNFSEMTMIQGHMVVVGGSLNMTKQEELLMFTSN